ncbi:MAG TPA: DDE-type integrase/transposase/recombinase [Nitrososphaerales archaeon]|nr:DDE-type integrase/transposase/recombinase [Nitrososphaerales archaeon]
MKLDDDKLRYIVRAREKGESCENIALHLSVSRRRVEQLCALYRATGKLPSLQKGGRRRSPLSEDERRVVLAAYNRYMVNAVYLGKMIEVDYGVHINHNRIHQVLRMSGFVTPSSKRWIKRRWVRYEREFSNSLWHTDWHEIKDPRWKGQWIVAYEDDASRFITGHGVYPTLTSKFSVDVLDEAIREHRRPRSIISDHGSTFYAVEAREREKGLTEFERYLLRNHIQQILGRVNHPQTNGKIEKWFDVLESKLKFFPSIDACVEWYNTVKPHGALDLKTPIRAYYEKMPQLDVIVDPSVIEREASL